MNNINDDKYREYRKKKILKILIIIISLLVIILEILALFNKISIIWGLLLFIILYFLKKIF